MIEHASREQNRIIKRLGALIEEHRESAERMGVSLGSEDVRAIIDALIAEAEQRDPKPFLSCPDDLRTYVRCTLYEELLGEPSNVLLATRVSDETMRYEAMPKSFWLECLHTLQATCEDAP